MMPKSILVARDKKHDQEKKNNIKDVALLAETDKPERKEQWSGLIEFWGNAGDSRGTSQSRRAATELLH